MKVRIFAQWLKITQTVSLDFFILAFFTNFCPVKSGLSTITVNRATRWPSNSKCERSSLRLQWLIQLFG